MSKEEAKKWHDFDAKLTPEDIIEMQTIDADCNDCKHFKRGIAVNKTQGICKVDGVFPMIQMGYTIFEGHCMKFDKPTRAYPTQFSGHECFEHRRAKPEPQPATK